MESEKAGRFSPSCKTVASVRSQVSCQTCRVMVWRALALEVQDAHSGRGMGDQLTLGGGIMPSRSGIGVR